MVKSDTEMNKGIYKILSNSAITATTGRSGIWKMVLEGDTSAITAPGQFVNIAVPGNYLRRPISICDWDGTTITIVYRIVGCGTMDMTSLKAGQTLDLISGLGNGFCIEGSKAPLLVGGGVGLPPMLALAKAFLNKGITPIALAGFGSSADAILLDEFRSLGIDLRVATMDGSLGVKGTVMALVAGDCRCLGENGNRLSLCENGLSDSSFCKLSDGRPFDKIYACGPKPMLKALSELAVDGEFSVEERMGCGFGICMGCSCKTRNGMKRVCKEGPVFKKEDLLW